MSTSTAWLTAILLVLVLLAGLALVELAAQAVAPLSDALMPVQTPIIGESWCIRADGGACP